MIIVDIVVIVSYNIKHIQRQCPTDIMVFNTIRDFGQLPVDNKAARKIMLESEQYVIARKVSKWFLY